MSLNPCCNGIWSVTVLKYQSLEKAGNSLNPCCNGIWSVTSYQSGNSHFFFKVLILVVMEYGL